MALPRGVWLTIYAGKPARDMPLRNVRMRHARYVNAAGVARRGLNMWRSPAAEVQPFQCSRFGEKDVAGNAAVLRHEDGDLLRVHHLGTTHQRHANRAANGLCPLAGKFVALE